MEQENKEQIIGLDLTKDKSEIEMTSGYLHFEKIENDENSKSETVDRGHHIRTKYTEYIKQL